MTENYANSDIRTEAKSTTDAPMFEPERKVILAGGSTAVLEPRWRHIREGTVDVIVSPEERLRVFLLCVAAGDDDEAAARNAWLSVAPTFSLKPRRIVRPPASDGWESSCQVVYDIPSSESRMVIADIRVFEGQMYIALIDSSMDLVARRHAHLAATLQSWRPSGFDRRQLDASAVREFSASEFDPFVKAALTKFQIPGAAIVVIENRRVVFYEIYGVKESGKPEPVDRATRFMIGSVTKPLTTLLMAQLVDQNKIGWDEAIKTRLPDFTLGDPELARTLSFRQSVSAGTGMPRRDMEFVFRGRRLSAAQLLDAMKAMMPTTAPGEAFQYSNLLVAAGGYAAAHACCPEVRLDLAYAKAMAEFVFRPLDMTGSSVAGANPPPPNRAAPHAIDLDQNMVPIPQEEAVESTAPSGAVWSTADDLARYVLMELNDGIMENGTRLVSTDALLERRIKGVKVDRDTRYGLGLFVEDYRGIEVIHHGGNTFGFTSDMLFVPDAGLGLVVLCNAGSTNSFRKAVRSRIFEMMFGDDPLAEKILDFGKTERVEGIARFRSRISVEEQKTAWLREWIGRYHNRDLGTIEFRSADDRVVLDSEGWTAGVGVHTESNGEKSIVVLDPPNIGLTFTTPDHGGDRRLLFDAGQVKYEFRRTDVSSGENHQPPRPMSSKALPAIR
jgi:CubicO group peptidase (beta-lactamase class C family)